MRKTNPQAIAAPSSFNPYAAFMTLLCCLLLIFAGGVWSSASAKVGPKQKPSAHRHKNARNLKRNSRAATRKLEREQQERVEEAREGVFEDDEDPEARLNWFMFQRSFPYKSVPEDARRRAWESRPKGRKGYEAEAQSMTWRSIGPTPTSPYAPLVSNFGLNSGRVNAIAVSPVDQNLILVGASTGGIWRSTDGGASFVPTTDNQVDLAVSSIAFSKSNPSIVYAGLGDMAGCCDYLGSGILRSNDGGQTWTHINNSTLPQPGAVSKIDVDPNDPNRVYVALYRSLDDTRANSFPYGGVYISTDGGVNWNNTLVGLPRDLVVDETSTNPQQRVLFVAMRGTGLDPSGGVGGVYKSSNGGLTWRQVYNSPYPSAFITGGLRDIRVAQSPANPSRVYVYLGRTSPAEVRLAVSNNGGESFSSDTILTTVDRGQLGYNTYLAVDPTDANTLYIGTRDVFKSTDGGATWVNITKNYDSSFRFQPNRANTHPDQHCLAFSPAGPTVIYIGNDGGLFRSLDGGSTFQSLNSTLSLTQFVSIARHPTDPTITYGGTQDNGTQKRLGLDGNKWEDFASGDGGRVVINPLDPGTIFSTYIYGSITRWRNNGQFSDLNTSNSTFSEPNSAPRIAFYPPLTGNGVNQTLYFGTWKLFTSPDLGQTWTAPSSVDLTLGSPDVLSAIGVARSNLNVIYTGSAQGRAMVTTDGGQSWRDITPNNPATGAPLTRFITGLTVSGSDPATAYLTVSGYGTGHIFKTANTGATWTDISGNLPNIPANALLIDPNNPNVLYLGTDVGVFRSTVGGTTWETFNNGLPPVVVTAFTTNANGEIQLATYGRGAYEATSTQSYSISGRVADSKGNGIAQATVTLSGAQNGTTTTDASGNYSFADLPSGSYILSPSKAGQFIGFARNADNLSGNLTGFDLRLDPYIQVNVRAADTADKGIEGVAIRSALLPLNGVLTNALGTVTLQIIPPSDNQFTLTAEKPGFNFSPQSATLNTQNGNQSVTFTGTLMALNAIDDARTFVTWHYRDFLNREPDPDGLAYWSSQITGCGADKACIHRRRIDVSAAFFIELEFQQTGSFIYRLYKGTLGRRPSFTEFTTDRGKVIAGANLDTSKAAFADEWVTRPEFKQRYADSLSPEEFVNKLFDTAGLTPYTAERAQLALDIRNGKSRGQAVREVIEIKEFRDREYNAAFVLMQYFGYLHRDPEEDGFLFWLNVLSNKEPGNFRGMVCSFITSAEYQLRFGSTVTRTNQDCSAQ